MHSTSIYISEFPTLPHYPCCFFPLNLCFIFQEKFLIIYSETWANDHLVRTTTWPNRPPNLSPWRFPSPLHTLTSCLMRPPVSCGLRPLFSAQRPIFHWIWPEDNDHLSGIAVKAPVSFYSLWLTYQVTCCWSGLFSDCKGVTNTKVHVTLPFWYVFHDQVLVHGSFIDSLDYCHTFVICNPEAPACNRAKPSGFLCS